MSATASTITYLIVAIVTIYSGLLLSACWLIVSRGRKPHSGEDIPGPEEMKRHMVGMYYCNADDPRGWVPKSGDLKCSNGYTINMRYLSWVTAYNAVFAGGLVVVTLLAVAAPLLIK